MSERLHGLMEWLDQFAADDWNQCYLRNARDVIKAQDAELSTLRSRCDTLEAERDEALRFADWNAIKNNTVVNEVWALLGGPDTTREGGQSLVVRVGELRAARDEAVEALTKLLTEARNEINHYADTAREHDLVARIDAALAGQS